MSEILTIRNDAMTASVCSFGAELTSFTKDGNEYIWNADPSIWEHSAPVLFPICGALKNDEMFYEGKTYRLPKHGLANKNEFKMDKIAENCLVATFQSSPETLSVYPFSFEFRVIYTLLSDGLRVDYEVDNCGDGLMYYSLGAHEGFACAGGMPNCTVTFDQPETLASYHVTGPLLDGTSHPVLNGETKLHLRDEDFVPDALIFKNPASRAVTLRDHISGHTVRYEFPDFSHLLLWTKPGAPYLCIEPWNAMPDSLDSDGDFTHKEAIMTLSAGQTATFTHFIRIGVEK